jgi:hypothetical protein
MIGFTPDVKSCSLFQKINASMSLSVTPKLLLCLLLRLQAHATELLTIKVY